MFERKAIFTDRDGVITNFDVDMSIPKVYAMRNPERMEILPDVFEFVRNSKKAGFLIIVVSNQPDIALGKIDEPTKEALEKKFSDLLKQQKISVDGIFYCHHHENSINPNYEKTCNCRKPKPGMIFDAALKLGIDTKKSFMIGDEWKDIVAGKEAGCTTILLGRPWSLQEKCEPDFVVSKLEEAVDFILKNN